MTDAEPAVEYRQGVLRRPHAAGPARVVPPRVAPDPVLHARFRFSVRPVWDELESGMQFGGHRTAEQPATRDLRDAAYELDAFDERRQIRIVGTLARPARLVEIVEVDQRRIERIDASQSDGPIAVAGMSFEDRPGELVVLVADLRVVDFVSAERQRQAEHE